MNFLLKLEENIDRTLIKDRSMLTKKQKELLNYIQKFQSKMVSLFMKR